MLPSGSFRVALKSFPAVQVDMLLPGEHHEIVEIVGGAAVLQRDDVMDLQRSSPFG